jgi:hypothetical protein
MPFSEEEKVRVLLNEYNTLRSELIARTGQGFQVLGLSVTALSILAAQPMNFKTISVFIAILALAGFAAWFTLRDITKGATRIRELELDVNARAGEDLLIWENLWGGWVTGFWGTAKPHPRQKLKSKAAPARSAVGPLIPPQSN